MLRRMLRWDKGAATTAGLAALLALWPMTSAGASDEPAAGSRNAHRFGRLPGKPAYLWLWYADGTSPQPEDGPYCTGLRPPAFQCSYGTDITDCQRQVQAILDAWYAGFNLVFTLTRPPTGDYYTMIITSQGTWCDQNSTEAGVAFFNCNDNPGQAGFAFECGKNAHACATIIAHEHGHMVGLEHTLVTADVMNESVQASATGFLDQDGRTTDQLCQTTQNSYQEMLAALGPWPGGTKPSPFATTAPDAAVADAPPDLRPADKDDAAVPGEIDAAPPDAGIDTGPIIALGGFDAVVRPPPPTTDAAGNTTPKSNGGCELGGRPAAPGAALVVPLALLALVFTRSCDRRRRARPARPAAEPLPCVAPARPPSAARARGR